MNETEHMLTALLDCERVDLYSKPVELSLDQRVKFKQMKERRSSGEPLQYILGFTDFMGLEIECDESVLIPRPETELLVESAVKYLKSHRSDNSKTISILDVGTGSGNIAVSLAQFLPEAQITAIDISRKAVQLAENNARHHQVADRIKFMAIDMKYYFLKRFFGGAKYDLIISNPPYIPSAEISHLPIDVQLEPKIALDGGRDGLQFYRQIIAAGSLLLKKGGALMCEFGDGQTEQMIKLFKNYPEYQAPDFFQDYTQTNRYFISQLWKN